MVESMVASAINTMANDAKTMAREIVSGLIGEGAELRGSGFADW